MPTASFTIGFATSTDRSSGSITYTDTTDWAGQSIDPADVEIAWGFTGPDGETYRQAVIGQAGNIFPDVALSASAGLPRALGVVQTGDYSVFATVSVTAGPEFSVGPIIHNLCTDFPTFVLTPVIDCLAGIVSIRDETPWTLSGFTVNTRTMTLQYPLVSQHANITSSGPTVTTGGLPIYRGTWATEAAWNVTRGNYTVDISGTWQFPVSCSSGSCERWCVIDSVYKQYLIAKANGEDWQQKQLKAKVDALVTLGTIMDRQEMCGRSDILDTLGRAFAQLTSDCQCDCGCDGDGTLITPAWQAIGGSNVELVEGDNILITNVGDTWTISVSPALMAIINSLYNTEVISSDSSVTITSAVVGLVKTFDLSVLAAKDFITWDVTFNVTAGTSSSSSPILYGDSFVNTVLITPMVGNYVYSITGIFPDPGTGPVPFKVWCDININGIVRNNPYNNTHRFYEFLEPKIYWDRSGVTTYIAFSFKLTDDGVGGLTGMDYPLSYFATFLSEVKVSFMIYKVD